MVKAMETPDTAFLQCIACNCQIDEKPFEQRLIDDHDFCRRRFDDLMDDESMSYMDNPQFLAPNVRTLQI